VGASREHLNTGSDGEEGQARQARQVSHHGHRVGWEHATRAGVVCCGVWETRIVAWTARSGRDFSTRCGAVAGRVSLFLALFLVLQSCAPALCVASYWGRNGVFIRSFMRRMCADRSGSSDDDREDVKKHAKDSETREQKMARRLAKK